jgi:hypothetical protein
MNRQKQILFAADNHFKTHAGKVLYEKISAEYDIEFHEDDWTCFNESNLAGKYSLIMLNMISGTCDVPVPDAAAEKNVKEYLETGAPLLLLHGSSAAFSQWSWWREIVGFRWVRNDDPEGFEESTHPVVPFVVEVAKCRHPLCKRLKEVDVPTDELYINLEQTCPTTMLMNTTTELGTFPMCYETISPWDGKIIGYIPGHKKEIVELENNISNCRETINYLLQ